MRTSRTVRRVRSTASETLASWYLWCVIIGQLVDDKIPSPRLSDGSCTKASCCRPCSDAVRLCHLFPSIILFTFCRCSFAKRKNEKKSVYEVESEKKQKKPVASVPFKGVLRSQCWYSIAFAHNNKNKTNKKNWVGIMDNERTTWYCFDSVIDGIITTILLLLLNGFGVGRRRWYIQLKPCTWQMAYGAYISRVKNWCEQ